MSVEIPDWLETSPDVRQAIEDRLPLVALESAVITHGLPRPINLELARRLEVEVRGGGAFPVTIACMHGRMKLGLTAEELEELALDEGAIKMNRRDLGPARAAGHTGGTTVSATMFAAHQAGIRILATGGIGGVHRGSQGDISADLPELARTPLAVVCSGAKAILDLARTLEWLETAGVPVIGWGVDEFPAFYSRASGLAVSARANTPQAMALILRGHWDLGLGSAVLVCVPCPEDDAIEPEPIQKAISEAETQARQSQVTGKDVTPFLLNLVSELTAGASLRANLALLRNNARRAAELAIAFHLLEIP